MYYPANYNPKNGQTRLRAHSDFGSLTVLFQHDIGGLEIFSPSGKWITAPVIADTPLINIGDFLEIWSGGMFKSTVHRLSFRNGSAERFSIPCFMSANADTILKPVREGTLNLSCPLNDMTAGEYYRRRLDFLHRGGDANTTPFITREDQPSVDVGFVPDGVAVV